MESPVGGLQDLVRIGQRIPGQTGESAQPVLLPQDTIVDSLGFTAERRGSVTSILEAMQCYVKGHINESVERRNFLEIYTATRQVI